MCSAPGKMNEDIPHGVDLCVTNVSHPKLKLNLKSEVVDIKRKMVKFFCNTSIIVNSGMLYKHEHMRAMRK